MFESLYHYKLYAILTQEHKERLQRREHHWYYRAERPVKPPTRAGLVLNLKRRLRKQKITG